MRMRSENFRDFVADEIIARGLILSEDEIEELLECRYRNQVEKKLDEMIYDGDLADRLYTEEKELSAVEN